ncbi:MAG: hypothetical protein LBU64_00080 [Planctomycetota bacterium]|jgi:hypothetical protein|nr:hypothetical protein [Planctomycetota bacterium]
MEIYFNPYPGAAKSEEEGIALTVNAADALLRLQKQCSDTPLVGRFSEMRGDLPPSRFILVRKEGVPAGIEQLIYRVNSSEREKIKFLLTMFSKGQIIAEEDVGDTENWIVSVVGAAAPVLELAAKRNAMALTVSAEKEWRVDVICFDNHENKLPNIWGQVDISGLTTHCIKSMTNARERFSAQFNARFCDGALHAAPDARQWENCGYFQCMGRAKKQGYAVDANLMRNVGHTNHGTLLELRCYGTGHRIFFAYRRGISPEVLIGGFYQKGIGDDATAQNNAIRNAIRRIDSYKDFS